MKPYALRPRDDLPKVYLYRDAVDFRKGHRGLSMIVEHEFGHNPFSGILTIFRNRACTKIRCLFREETGFVLYYKALSEERFHWPRADDPAHAITGEQLNWLRDGFDLSLMKTHRRLAYRTVG